MIKAEPLSYALGAELTSIDMREALEEQDIRLIQETWHGQHVIVLRNQDADPEDILRFARSFGSLDNHEALRVICSYLPIIVDPLFSSLLHLREY